MAFIYIPPTLRRNVVDAWGTEGQDWLATVPSLVQELADAWDLQIHGPAAPYPSTVSWR
jgi:streptomycin 6-kinase